MTLDVIPTLNLVLSAVILVLGFLTYQKSRDALPLYVGIAFAFFGVSHLLTVLGYTKLLENVLIVIRVIGYLMVIFGLFRAASKR